MDDFERVRRWVDPIARYQAAMIELHGAHLHIDDGWRLVHEKLDPATGFLAVITQHDGRGLIKAELYFRDSEGRYEQDLPPLPVWSSALAAKALFRAEGLAEAIEFAGRALRNRGEAMP
jgi:hypothetical protein